MSGLYNLGIKEVMAGNVDLINDEVTAWLIDTDFYTPDFDNDLSQANIPDEAVIAEAMLLSKTLDGSTFRANDTTFNNVTGAKVGAIVVCKNTTEYETSFLLAYIDSAPELPITPNGEDITIQWDTGAAGIFKL